MSISDGIAYGVTDAGSLDFTDRFTVPATRADDAIERALALVADGSTLRAGRLLAPLGIRYVVVPKTDGVVSTVDRPDCRSAEGLVGGVARTSWTWAAVRPADLRDLPQSGVAARRRTADRRERRSVAAGGRRSRSPGPT